MPSDWFSPSEGKKKGFAFFTSDSKECGQRVIQELKAVNGRPVAVDWALEKSVYVSKLSASEGEKGVPVTAR